MENENTNDLKRTVEITLNGETRTVEIERYSTGHCWFALTPVVCKFVTGTKLHTAHRPQVFEKSKQRGACFTKSDYFFGTEVIHNRHARVIAWADKQPGNSDWTRNQV